MSRRVVFHVGMSRCAGKFLAKDLFSAHSEVRNIGKPDPDPHCLEIIYQLLGDKEYDEKRCRGLFERHIEPILDTHCVTVSYSPFTYSYYDTSQDLPDRIRKAFGPVLILMVIREQISWLKSAYPHIDPARSLTFEDWIQAHWDEQSILTRFLRYDYLASKYVAQFGQENCCVLLLEELISNREQFAAQISSFMGIGFEETLRLIGAKPRGEADSRMAYRLQRTPGLKKIARRVFRALPAPIRSIASKATGHNSKYVPEIGDETMRRIQDHVRSGNAHLAEAWSLPLSEHGYAC